MISMRVRKFNSATQKVKEGPGAAGIWVGRDGNGSWKLKINADGSPQTVESDITLSYPLLAASADALVFLADGSYQLTGIRHVVSTGASGATVAVKKCTGTTAPAAGDAMHASTLNLNATANTPVTTAVNTVNTLVAGDRIALDFSGTLTNLTGTITLTLKRL